MLLCTSKKTAQVPGEYLTQSNKYHISWEYHTNTYMSAVLDRSWTKLSNKKAVVCHLIQTLNFEIAPKNSIQNAHSLHSPF